MSRIGKQPVTIANGVEVKQQGNVLVFKKDKLESKLDTRGHVDVKIEKGEIIFNALSENRQDRAYWGTYRSLAHNIIIGLTEGYKKQLEINGVGYKAAVKGNTLELQLGFSHPINYEFPKEVKVSVEKNIITIEGNDKQVIGQIAAEVRSFRPPEPYKGKGVKYVEERIIRKAGKTAKK